jgi:hypothetical protein
MLVAGGLDLCLLSSRMAKRRRTCRQAARRARELRVRCVDLNFNFVKSYGEAEALGGDAAEEVDQ